MPGVGKKVAQRVVLDLKDRLGAEDVVIVDGPLADVREALLALGLSPQEASDAMTGLAADGDASGRGPPPRGAPARRVGG